MIAVIGKQSGDYLAGFHSSHGMGIGALIAATAYVHALCLWTR
jgi:hypothetical protein